MSVIDWAAKPEPWRSIGLRFIEELKSDWVLHGSSTDRLRRAVYACALPRKAIENKAAIASGNLSRYMREEYDVPYNRRAVLARVLGVKPRDIWTDFKTTSEETIS